MHGFRSIILLYSYMDATGIGTMDVNMHIFLKARQIFG